MWRNNKKKKKILGIITARGGSKSIPRKNIKSFAGKPLIVWSIETGLKSGVLDRLIVTTDDKEIADISKAAGAEVPFIRPSELALDGTPTLPVLQHAVDFLREKEKYEPDYVLLLEPTSPGRQSFHLIDAVKLIKETGADSVIALGEVPKHFSPHWQFNLSRNNKAQLFNGQTIQNIIERRQDLPETFFRNGVFYLFKTSVLFGDEPDHYGDDVRGYITETKYSFDIDSKEDWEAAERNFLKLLAEKNRKQK